MKKSLTPAIIIAAIIVFFLAFLVMNTNTNIDTQADKSTNILGKQNNTTGQSPLAAAQNIKSVPTTEFNKSLSASQKTTPNNVIILDVRTTEQYNQGHLEGAVHLDFTDPNFAQKLAKLDKSKEYFLYCNSGNKSKVALALMDDLDFKSVLELDSGIQGWQLAGLSVCQDC